MFAHNISRELRGAGFTKKKTPIDYIMIYHMIYQGNWNTKESIEGEEGEKP